MKPITINIKNLIGKMVVTGDKESASTQIQESVNDALLKVLKTATESTEVPISIEVKSDLLSKIPPHKLSQIVEATLCQLQKAVVSSWLNDAEIEPTSEELALRNRFFVTSHIHLQ